MSKINRSSWKRGFTLIELLVVISIIALLVSILLPVLKSARQAGERVLCSSNQRQIGIAYHIYADDYNGYFRPGYVATEWPTTYEYYLLPYLTKGGGNASTYNWTNLPEALLCASDPDGELNFNSGNPALAGYKGSYRMNLFVSDPPYENTLYWYRVPSDQIFFFCSNATTHGWADHVKEWHNEAANYLFIDGHGETWQDPGPLYVSIPNMKYGWTVIE